MPSQIFRQEIAKLFGQLHISLAISFKLSFDTVEMQENYREGLDEEGL